MRLRITICCALNRPTQDWGQFLGDVPATTAILDRFLAHAEIIQMQGKSYRLHQRARHGNGDADRPTA
jgi:DNA replication protein DnaC